MVNEIIVGHRCGRNQNVLVKRHPHTWETVLPTLVTTLLKYSAQLSTAGGGKIMKYLRFKWMKWWKVFKVHNINR
jgi:hypothetical protein